MRARIHAQIGCKTAPWVYFWLDPAEDFSWLISTARWALTLPPAKLALCPCTAFRSSALIRGLTKRKSIAFRYSCKICTSSKGGSTPGIWHFHRGCLPRSPARRAVRSALQPLALGLKLHRGASPLQDRSSWTPVSDSRLSPTIRDVTDRFSGPG